MAFKMAGIFAFKDAMKKATPILLEPIMKVEVSTPDEYQGELIGDLIVVADRSKVWNLVALFVSLMPLYLSKTCLGIQQTCDHYPPEGRIIL